MNIDETWHNGFLTRLDESDADTAHKAFICRWLQGRFIETHMPKSTRAPTASQWQGHADAGDIWGRHRGLGLWAKWMRFEVKGVLGVKRQFTCAADFKFPDFFVCSKQSFDSAEIKPEVYFQVTKDFCYCGLQFVSDSGLWVPRQTGDEDRPGRKQITYCCPKEAMLFFDLRDPGMPERLSKIFTHGRLLLASDKGLRPPGFILESRAPVSF